MEKQEMPDKDDCIRDIQIKIVEIENLLTIGKEHIEYNYPELFVLYEEFTKRITSIRRTVAEIEVH